MAAFLPGAGALGHLGIVWLIAVVLFGTGSAMRQPIAGGRTELQIMIGWGLWSVLATAWTVLTPFNLAIAAALFLLIAIYGLLRGTAAAGWRWLGCLFVISLPFGLVLAPIRPAEPDTWLNLLPNANYLVDWGALPVSGGPPSYSFLPAAPYATQFLAFLGGLVQPDYPVSGMSLDNFLLLIVAGAAIARTAFAARERDPGWRAAAAGLLLATFCNIGFVLRIHLAAYGETGLAATAVIAAILSVEARDGGWDAITALGLVLAAMVGVKQSGFGLVAAIAAASIATSWLERRRPPMTALKTIAGALAFPVLLALLWRWYVARAGVDELKPLAFDQWQWGNIPAILGSMAHVGAQKLPYFLCVAASLAAAPLLLRRIGWNFATRMLVFNAGLFIFYTGFLVLTYIAHFPGIWSTEAHSFFRYETHLSLVLMLALALAARECVLLFRPALGAALTHSRPLAASIIALALLLPIGLARPLRFDLDMPQPLVWAMAKNLAPLLGNDARLALLLPGDNGSLATMLEGVLRETPPRHRSIAVAAIDGGDKTALDRATAAGYTQAFVSCTGTGLDDVPAGHMALMARDQGAWHARAVWDYPARKNREHWQHILAWPPLCRVP